MEYPLQQLREDVWVMQGRTNTGIVKINEEHCLLIDPGQDKENVKQVMTHLANLHLKPSTVLITHAHADHFGAGYYFPAKQEISFYASAFESSLIEQPLLEPIFLFGGAEPIAELKFKFILAKPVPITQRLTAGEWSLQGKNFRIIDLPGHSPGQIGLWYAGLFFTGDAITLKSYIDKFKFPFYTDIEKAISTLKMITNTEVDLLIPGHGSLMDREKIDQEVGFNIQYLQEFVGCIARIVSQNPATEESIIKAVADELDLPMTTVIQFTLNRTLVLAALKYLQDSEKVISYIENNQWLWKSRS